MTQDKLDQILRDLAEIKLMLSAKKTNIHPHFCMPSLGAEDHICVYCGKNMSGTACGSGNTETTYDPR